MAIALHQLILCVSVLPYRIFPMPIVQIILFFPSFCKAAERCRQIALFSCGQVYLPYCSPPRQYLFWINAQVVWGRSTTKRGPSSPVFLFGTKPHFSNARQQGWLWQPAAGHRQRRSDAGAGKNQCLPRGQDGPGADTRIKHKNLCQTGCLPGRGFLISIYFSRYSIGVWPVTSWKIRLK